MRRPPVALALALLVTLGVRLLVFPINEHVYGDAVARTELAEHWAGAPHLITSFEDGAAQFGPLHLYLVGAALTWFDRDDAARVVSLLFGLLTTIPVFALTRHYFGSLAAFAAALGLGLWGLHVQASTTGGSEAVALFLLWVAFAWYARALYRPHWLPVAVAAAAMNLAAATRYDAWMYIPLLAALMPWLYRDRSAGLRHGALFLLLALPFPLLWMAGNAIATGDPLHPLSYIEAYHRTWAAETAATPREEAWLRIQGLGFWPAIAVFTLTPGVALLGMVGMAAAWRARPPARWLVVCCLGPTLYYSARTAVLADFVPLGRFTMVQASLLLPFVGQGLVWIAGDRGLAAARRVAQASLALAIVLPLGLGFFTWRSESTVARVLAPLSPVTTNPRPVMAAAAVLRARAAIDPGVVIAVDADDRYRDLALAFYARLAEERLVRVRWPDIERRFRLSRPDLIAVFADGQLTAHTWVQASDDALVVLGDRYRLMRREGPVQLFERVGP